MSNYNRLIFVLVEHQKTGKWLANQLGRSTVLLVNRAELLSNQIENIK